MDGKKELIKYLKVKEERSRLRRIENILFSIVSIVLALFSINYTIGGNAMLDMFLILIGVCIIIFMLLIHSVFFAFDDIQRRLRNLKLVYKLSIIGGFSLLLTIILSIITPRKDKITITFWQIIALGPLLIFFSAYLDSKIIFGLQSQFPYLYYKYWHIKDKESS